MRCEDDDALLFSDSVEVDENARPSEAVEESSLPCPLNEQDAKVIARKAMSIRNFLFLICQ